jgi:hypothetical protein
MSVKVFRLNDDGTREPVSIDWEKAQKADRLPDRVDAVKMDFPFLLKDSRGEKRGEAGDILIKNRWGCLYLTTGLVFKHTYRLAGGHNKAVRLMGRLKAFNARASVNLFFGMLFALLSFINAVYAISYAIDGDLFKTAASIVVIICWLFLFIGYAAKFSDRKLKERRPLE